MYARIVARISRIVEDIFAMGLLVIMVLRNNCIDSYSCLETAAPAAS